MTLYDEIPDETTLLVNHENRILQLEHQIAALEGRMPKSRIRRIFWWISSLFPLVMMWIGLLGTFLGPTHELGAIFLLIGFGTAVTKASLDIGSRRALGPRPHKSLLVKDHR